MVLSAANKKHQSCSRTRHMTPQGSRQVSDNGASSIFVAERTIMARWSLSENLHTLIPPFLCC